MSKTIFQQLTKYGILISSLACFHSMPINAKESHCENRGIRTFVSTSFENSHHKLSKQPTLKGSISRVPFEQNNKKSIFLAERDRLATTDFRVKSNNRANHTIHPLVELSLQNNAITFDSANYNNLSKTTSNDLRIHL